MTKQFKIYFNDLKEEAQKDLLKVVDATYAKEMNWDMNILLIAILEFEMEEPPKIKELYAARQKKPKDDDISTYQEYSYMRHPDRVEMGTY